MKSNIMERCDNPTAKEVWRENDKSGPSATGICISL